ncbi:MAG: transcription-repair coupling factor [Bdellovibrionales bacterium GWA2_49_15]|nr:MAG: transcription-repair coupling factor [Bdellovibrionales bacterium GWA2_49_15]
MLRALQLKLLEWLKTGNEKFVINGVSSSQFGLLWNHIDTGREWEKFKFLLITHNDTALESLMLTLHANQGASCFFPTTFSDPYSPYIPSEQEFNEKFIFLNQLELGTAPHIVGATMFEVLKRLCPLDWVAKHTLALNENDIIAHEELCRALVARGYRNTLTLDGPGTFSKRGEIFDIYIFGQGPVRIYFFDELIEAMHSFDQDHQRIDKSTKLSSIKIGPTPSCVLSDPELRLNLRANLPMPSPNQKNKIGPRNHVLSCVNEAKSFERFPNFFPLFFSGETPSFFEYLLNKNYIPVLFDERSLSISLDHLREELEAHFNSAEKSNQTDNILPRPGKLYNFDAFLKSPKSLGIENFHLDNNPDLQSFVHLSVQSPHTFWGQKLIECDTQHDLISKKFSILESFIHAGGLVSFLSTSDKAKQEFLFLAQKHLDAPADLINIVTLDATEGLFLKDENILLLSESDIFGVKKKLPPRPKTKSVDLFAEKMASLAPDDFVIHAQFGVGKYLGVESLFTGGSRSDYFVIEYAEKDKVYVPVFKIDQIQKHADSTASYRLDTLRNSKFAQAKKRAKESAKKLAFDLLQLNAARALSRGFAFSPPDHLYNEFELAFPYDETPDQLSAIEAVLDKMQDSKPMDFLVCGDVGFGKTEVAMRAAFKAILDKKQVAVLAPTTILTLQHFHTFQERFKQFPVKIDFLSRFKSAKECKEIINQLKLGNIDIVIGTHKLLSSDVGFKDLGLVIVDEEHRFGVGHKEKLKLLKNAVDFLTLTATPIPRTLQLSFLGLRDIALIRTPPPNRQSIKTYIVHDDLEILRTAILNETSRGGQVFVVHNKVQDMESYAAKIHSIAPDVSISFAHGQMNETQLEKIISDFYSGKFQVLICTTIIESGIDIPNANTMIIDRADTFGLAQLHQLRGRIGRSDRKAYAYFIIPERTIGAEAERRIKALQQYAELGSGFNLASADMEIRGAGDILGAEQSGHIEIVGLELYLELLQEAINELKGQEADRTLELEINISFPCYIPSDFICDPSERLRQYKLLSRFKKIEQLDEAYQELENYYEKIPVETANLFYILKSKIILGQIGVTAIAANDKSVTIKFLPEVFEKHQEWRSRLIDFLLREPKTYRINQDYSFSYYPKAGINAREVFNFAKIIAQQIKSC